MCSSSWCCAGAGRARPTRWRFLRHSFDAAGDVARTAIGRVSAAVVVVLLVFAVLGADGVCPSTRPSRSLPRYRGGIWRKSRMCAAAGRVRQLRKHWTDRAELKPRRRGQSRSPSSWRRQVAGFSGFAWLGPFVRPLGTAGLVLTMVISMLFERRDLRSAHGLIGHGHLAQTTKAFDPCESRRLLISRS